MIAVVSVPMALAGELQGRRINPIGAKQAKRAYALDVIRNDSPLALAMVVSREDDSRTIRWFADNEAAIIWATLDACQRANAMEAGR